MRRINVLGGASWPSRINCCESRITSYESRLLWRASPHCMVVNLVRSGRKQPQLFLASAGGKARLPFQSGRRFVRALESQA